MSAPPPTASGHGSGPLTSLLAAESVAVVGASIRPGSVGATTIAGLIEGGYPGRVYPVNPSRAEIGGLTCYPSLDHLPERVDLAVLAVANARLEAQLQLAAETGARAAVIFASAFEESSGDRPPLTHRLAGRARSARMALCGPSSMGFVNPARSLRICGYQLPRDLGPGPVALVSHSGSSFSALLHGDRGLRFSVAISAGQELVTTTADYLRYCLGLPHTRVVGLILEQIRDPEGFASAMITAHELDIPVVALKMGRTAAAKRLVAAHSGALAGDDGAYEAFFDAHGVHRVRDLAELADTLELLAAPRRAQKGGLGAVTDSGGERALLVDLAADLPVPELATATAARLGQVLDPGLPAVNPVDAWDTGADAARVFREALMLLHDDPAIGAVAFAVDLTGGSSDRYVSVATATMASTAKPFVVLAHYPPGMNRLAAARLRAAGIPVLEGTATGLAALRHLFDHRDFRDRPRLIPPEPPGAGVRETWRSRLASGAPVSEAEALALLADWGIPVARTISATTEEAALAAAAEIGWPVALKTAALAVRHKSDVRGVYLGLQGPDQLADAYRACSRRLGPAVNVQAMAGPGIELALGVVRDPDFGPVVVVGAGGELVELIGDRRVALPPIDQWRARRLIDGLTMRPLLDGFRGRPRADVGSAARALAQLSGLARDLPEAIEGLDVNPLVIMPDGCVAVDALVICRSPDAPSTPATVPVPGRAAGRRDSSSHEAAGIAAHNTTGGIALRISRKEHHDLA